MNDPVRGEEPKSGEEKKAGSTETDRRTLLRTAGLAGAAGAALAGAMHGKFSGADGNNTLPGTLRTRVTQTLLHTSMT